MTACVVRSSPDLLTGGAVLGIMTPARQDEQTEAQRAVSGDGGALAFVQGRDDLERVHAIVGGWL